MKEHSSPLFISTHMLGFAFEFNEQRNGRLGSGTKQRTSGCKFEITFLASAYFPRSMCL
jgi:hypothetical protein